MLHFTNELRGLMVFHRFRSARRHCGHDQTVFEGGKVERIRRGPTEEGR